MMWRDIWIRIFIILWIGGERIWCNEMERYNSENERTIELDENESPYIDEFNAKNNENWILEDVTSSPSVTFAPTLSPSTAQPKTPKPTQKPTRKSPHLFL